MTRIIHSKNPMRICKNLLWRISAQPIHSAFLHSLLILLTLAMILLATRFAPEVFKVKL